MQRTKLIYIKNEHIRTDNGDKKYNVFLDQNNRLVAIKHNKVLQSYVKFVEQFVYQKEYEFFLFHGSAQGIKSDNVFIFNYASRIIMEKDNLYYQLNEVSNKQPLTESKAKAFFIKFLKKID